VIFQPDPDNEQVKEVVIWQIESPFRIIGRGEIVVEKGSIHFLLKEYVFQPGDGEGGGEGGGEV
jgi:hypothetical protein